MKEKQWKGIQEAIRTGRNDARLYEFLKRKYSRLHIMEYGGTTFPNAIFVAPPKQRDHVDSVLDKPVLKEAPEDMLSEISQSGQAYLNELRKTPANPWDGTTYRMLNIHDEDGNLKISCGLGSYFNMLKSSETLELELLREFAQRSPSNAVFDWFDKQLILRRRLESYVSDSVKHGSGRSAAVSVSALTMFQMDRGGYKALIWERSSDKVSIYTDILHVLPSGMLQPLVDDFDNEYSVEHNVYREYLEEVFNVEEVRRSGGHATYDYFYENPNLLYLKDLIKDNKAKILLTGIAVDLLDLRPEICVLILIQTTEWFENHSRGKKVGDLQLKSLEFVDEFKHRDELHAKGIRGTQLLELSDDLILPSGYLKPENFTPQGAAALLLGLQVARDVLRDDP